MYQDSDATNEAHSNRPRSDIRVPGNDESTTASSRRHQGSKPHRLVLDNDIACHELTMVISHVDCCPCQLRPATVVGGPSFLARPKLLGRLR